MVADGYEKEKKNSCPYLPLKSSDSFQEEGCSQCIATSSAKQQSVFPPFWSRISTDFRSGYLGINCTTCYRQRLMTDFFNTKHCLAHSRGTLLVRAILKSFPVQWKNYKRAVNSPQLENRRHHNIRYISFKGG